MQHDDLFAVLRDSQRALAAERQHRYVNVQGRRQRFDQFLGQTLRKLMSSLGRNDDNFGNVQEIHADIARYGQMTTSKRMETVQRVEVMLSAVKKNLDASANPLMKADSSKRSGNNRVQRSYSENHYGHKTRKRKTLLTNPSNT